MQTTVSDVVSAVRDELARQGTNAFRAARSAKLPDDSIRYLLDGREPKLSRLIDVCRALGLEFYVGPPRPSSYGVPERQMATEVREPDPPPPYLTSNMRPRPDGRLVTHMQIACICCPELATIWKYLNDHWRKLSPPQRDVVTLFVVSFLEGVASGGRPPGSRGVRRMETIPEWCPSDPETQSPEAIAAHLRDIPR